MGAIQSIGRTIPARIHLAEAFGCCPSILLESWDRKESFAFSAVARGC